MSDHDDIRQTVLDYFEGWFDGDTARMERALHPDLAKRRAGEELGITTKPRMVELTAQGAGEEDRADVHLVRTAGGWRIADALWQLT